MTRTTPRRQTEPPNEVGLWVRYQPDRVRLEVYLFHATRKTPPLELLDTRADRRDGLLTPARIHWPGDEWEGPFPVPAVVGGEVENNGKERSE